MTTEKLVVRQLAVMPYQPVYLAMQAFTEKRSAKTHDELWFLEHKSVYTQGRAGQDQHILNTNKIPVVQSDRGGQVTYHGLGQLTVYMLLDLKRLGFGVRDLVSLIESSLVATLAHWGIESSPRSDAPGVYVDGAKIAALGLRIKKGCSYHGLNLNIDMDMDPWSGINPCGLGVPVTQMATLIDKQNMPSLNQVLNWLLSELSGQLGYNKSQWQFIDRLP